MRTDLANFNRKPGDTLYRIYTENKNRGDIQRILSESATAYTIIEAIGYWDGIPEKTLIIEILADSGFSRFAEFIANSIRVRNQQDCVLISEISISAHIV